jgi:hypothetical protein
MSFVWAYLAAIAYAVLSAILTPQQRRVWLLVAACASVQLVALHLLMAE